MKAVRRSAKSMLGLAALVILAMAWHQDLARIERINERLSRELTVGRQPPNRLVTIKVNHWTTLGGVIRAGDHVDLIRVGDETAKVILQDVVVAAVGAPDNAFQAPATLVLNKRQAHALANELPAIWATIRPPFDRLTAAQAAEPIHLSDVLSPWYVHQSVEDPSGSISSILDAIKSERFEAPPWVDWPYFPSEFFMDVDKRPRIGTDDRMP